MALGRLSTTEAGSGPDQAPMSGTLFTGVVSLPWVMLLTEIALLLFDAVLVVCTAGVGGGI